MSKTARNALKAGAAALAIAGTLSACGGEGEQYSNQTGGPDDGLSRRPGTSQPQVVPSDQAPEPTISDSDAPAPEAVNDFSTCAEIASQSDAVSTPELRGQRAVALICDMLAQPTEDAAADAAVNVFSPRSHVGKSGEAQMRDSGAAIWRDFAGRFSNAKEKLLAITISRTPTIRGDGSVEVDASATTIAGPGGDFSTDEDIAVTKAFKEAIGGAESGIPTSISFDKQGRILRFSAPTGAFAINGDGEIAMGPADGGPSQATTVAMSIPQARAALARKQRTGSDDRLNFKAAGQTWAKPSTVSV